MEWKLLDTGKASAEENMRRDASLLDSLPSDPILHVYDWEKPSITYGYFLRPELYLNEEALREYDIDCARRPTGGGITFHMWDWAFSVWVPSSCSFYSSNTLANYAFVNEAVLETVNAYLGSYLELISLDGEELDPSCSFFCMAKPTKYDVVWRGRKIAGAAQRRGKKGFLHQGSIALVMPPRDYLQKILLPGTKVIEAIEKYTSPLANYLPEKKDLVDLRRELGQLLFKNLAKRT